MGSGEFSRGKDDTRAILDGRIVQHQGLPIVDDQPDPFHQDWRPSVVTAGKALAPLPRSTPAPVTPRNDDRFDGQARPNPQVRPMFFSAPQPPYESRQPSNDFGADDPWSVRPTGNPTENVHRPAEKPSVLATDPDRTWDQAPQPVSNPTEVIPRPRRSFLPTNGSGGNGGGIDNVNWQDARDEGPRNTHRGRGVLGGVAAAVLLVGGLATLDWVHGSDSKPKQVSPGPEQTTAANFVPAPKSTDATEHVSKKSKTSSSTTEKSSKSSATKSTKKKSSSTDPKSPTNIPSKTKVKKVPIVPTLPSSTAAPSSHSSSPTRSEQPSPPTSSQTSSPTTESSSPTSTYSPTTTETPTPTETVAPPSYEPTNDVQKEFKQMIDHSKKNEVKNNSGDFLDDSQLEGMAGLDQLGASDLQNYQQNWDNFYANTDDTPSAFTGSSLYGADQVVANSDNFLEYAASDPSHLDTINLADLNNFLATKDKADILLGKDFNSADQVSVLDVEKKKLNDGTEVVLVASWADYGNDSQKIAWNMILPVSDNQSGDGQQQFVGVTVARQDYQYRDRSTERPSESSKKHGHTRYHGKH